MPTMRSMKKPRGKRKGVLVTELRYAEQPGAEQFARADLLFFGVDHSSVSFDVRVFLNNMRAGPNTPRDPALGYAGRFVVFGHGGCFGEDGHCHIRVRTGDVYDRRPSHALVPQSKIVTITHSLRSILDSGDALEEVTLVPYVRMPRRKDRYCGDGVFSFEAFRLQTYS